MDDCILLLIFYDALWVEVVGSTRNLLFELYVFVEFYLDDAILNEWGSGPLLPCHTLVFQPFYSLKQGRLCVGTRTPPAPVPCSRRQRANGRGCAHKRECRSSLKKEQMGQTAAPPCRPALVEEPTPLLNEASGAARMEVTGRGGLPSGTIVPLVPAAPAAAL